MPNKCTSVKNLIVFLRYNRRIQRDARMLVKQFLTPTLNKVAFLQRMTTIESDLSVSVDGFEKRTVAYRPEF